MHTMAADSASEMDLESDTSSMDGSNPLVSREQLLRRVNSLQQENRVLKIEIEALKLKVKGLQQANHELKVNSVNIQARAEQEEEFISNTLMKKISALKKEKESLAMSYEQEEEYLTNDLSRKLNQLRQEKMEVEQTLEREQEAQVNKLNRRIDKLETDVLKKQESLEQLRRERFELEVSLEHEHEALVNRLWKRMEKLETEKRSLQEKLDLVPSPPSNSVTGQSNENIPTDSQLSDTGVLSSYVNQLRQEVGNLRHLLTATQTEHAEKTAQYEKEERHLMEENMRLRKKLQMEVERRTELCRHLSESESSLEMDEERHFNESSRFRAISSPAVSLPGRPLSPLVGRCRECGQPLPPVGSSPSPVSPSLISHPHLRSSSSGGVTATPVGGPGLPPAPANISKFSRPCVPFHPPSAPVSHSSATVSASSPPIPGSMEPSTTTSTGGNNNK